MTVVGSTRRLRRVRFAAFRIAYFLARELVGPLGFDGKRRAYNCDGCERGRDCDAGDRERTFSSIKLSELVSERRFGRCDGLVVEMAFEIIG